MKNQAILDRTWKARVRERAEHVARALQNCDADGFSKLATRLAEIELRTDRNLLSRILGPAQGRYSYRCCECLEYRTPECFHRDRSRKIGHQSRCKFCSRERELKRHRPGPAEREARRKDAHQRLRNSRIGILHTRLPSRIEAMCAEWRIRTVGELLEHDPREFERVVGVGRKTVQEAKAVLGSMGFDWAGPNERNKRC